MRNPAGKIVVYLALLAAGILLVYLGGARWDGTGETWFGFVLMLAGLLSIAFGAVYLVMASLYARGRAKLLDGRGLIARWHVSAGEWARFVRIDQLRRETDAGFANDFNAAKQAADLGVDILVGRTGVAIGDYYQTLRRGGLPGLVALYWLPPPADPQCLEFHARYPRSRFGGSVPICIRFPIARGADLAARRVYDHFEPLLRPRDPIALRNPALTIRIALAVALASAIAAAWGFASVRSGGELNVTATIAAVIGAILVLPALVLALAAFILSRRRPG
jgi:hypothetical protein